MKSHCSSVLLGCICAENVVRFPHGGGVQGGAHGKIVDWDCQVSVTTVVSIMFDIDYGDNGVEEGQNRIN